MALRVKICCMASIEEAHAAIRLGATAIGLVSRMPRGPGPIEEALITRIVSAVSPAIETFLLTCETSADAIAAQQRRTGAGTLQLVDAVEDGAHRALRAELPDTRIVQVIHVTGEDSVDEALAVAADVDALLLDSGNPKLVVKELGGTGRRHDWALSRRIVDASPVPVYLAGGLNAGNVREAVETVGPFGVDVCSGVRTDGRLDEAKLAQFMSAALG
ncbi:MAG TPA: phosphoribosylanthranilate isomerase [Gemmatimonadaceae bacterium]|nr:phosphoribosylanthranilate isomerase [Gemmatimonadaceae bacterium]